MALLQLLRNVRFRVFLISTLMTAIGIASIFLLNYSNPEAQASPPERPLARACSSFENVVVCGDTFVLTNGSPSSYSGNVTLQKLGDPNPFVVIEDWIDAQGADRQGTVYLNENGSAAVGSFRLISDTLPIVLHKGDFEWLCLNTDTAVLENTNDCFPGLGNLSPLDPTQRNLPDSLALNFLDRMGMRPWYQTQFSQTNISQINFRFELGPRQFFFQTPIRIDLRDNDENPNLEIAATVTIDQKGDIKTGRISDFEVIWGAVKLDAREIVITKTQFIMGALVARAIKNPDLAFVSENGDEIFRLSNVKYVSNTFRIDGIEVPIRSFTFGNTGTNGFQMINQRLGLTVDPNIKKGVFVISSTLRVPHLGNDPDFTDVQTSLRLSAGIVTGTNGLPSGVKPSGIATVQNLSLKTKIANFNLEGIAFVFSASEDFYGIRASQARIQWSANLGGQTGAGLGGLSFGFKGNGDLVWTVGNGTLSTPPIKSGVFQGTSLTGTSGAPISGTVTLTLTGSLQLSLPGGAKNDGGASINPVATMLVRIGKNVKATCPANTSISICAKHYEARLSGFGFTLAGFKMKVVDPKLRDDGGFEVGVATLGLPAILNSSITTSVQSLVVAGNRDITVGGGIVQIPPIKFAGHDFVGMKGGFETVNQTVNGVTEKYHKFTGGASLSIPGLDPTSGQKFDVDVTVITKPPQGELDELDVAVAYQTRPGIPLASTGFEIVRFSGSFQLKPEALVVISIGLGTETTAKFPIPALNTSIPLASIDGQATLTVNRTPDPDTYKFTLGAQLKLLVFQIATASIEMGDGAGFRACPPGNTGPVSSCPRAKGFHANVTVEAIIVHATGDVRIGKVSGTTKIAGSLSGTVGIEKGQFGTAKPPFDVSVGFSGQCCEFNIPGSANARGFMFSLQIPGPWDPTIFIDFSKTIGSGGFAKIVDPDDYVLISSVEINELLARAAPGYQRISERVRRTAADGSDETVTIQAVTVPINVIAGTTTIFDVHWVGDPGTTAISVKFPASRGSTIVTPANVGSFNGVYNADFSSVITKGNDLVYIIGDMAPGTYELIIDNPPAAYEVVSFGSNAAPTLSNVFANCGGAAIGGVAVQCNGVAAGSLVTVTWTAADTDNADAKASVWYAQVPTATTSSTITEADLGNLFPIAENLPLGNGSAVWSLQGVPSGNYLVVVKVDDGRHPSTAGIANKTLTANTLVVLVNDTLPPAVPVGLAATPLPKMVNVTWNQNTEADLGGYEIGFGLVPDVAQFLYTRDMGPKEDSTGVLSKTDARLWGLEDNVTIYFGIRAYDINGNFSAWSPLVSAKPWDLSPNQFGPAPNSVNLASTRVQVVFLTPTGMDQATLQSALTLTGPGGAIPLVFEPIYDLDGVQIIGGSYTPRGGVLNPVAVTATVKGGTGGVRSLAGAAMNGDFSWGFTLLPSTQYLPSSAVALNSGW